MSVIERHTSPVSRGKVKCDTCNTTISKGTRYDAYITIGYGQACTFRVCPWCQPLWDILMAEADFEDYGDDIIPVEEFEEFASSILALMRTGEWGRHPDSTKYPSLSILVPAWWERSSHLTYAEENARQTAAIEHYKNKKRDA